MKFSITEAAILAGTCRSNWYRWEMGLSKITKEDDVQRVYLLTGVSPNDLYGIKDRKIKEAI
ncbi:MAG: hypothetical protein KBB83_06735 [Alphaproteobacteria bacterium]|nr:hypothetical protein [Alphaproteobacteria bacterium]